MSTLAEQFHQQALARLNTSACDAERCRDAAQLYWERGVIHVDADACNDSRAFQLREDARAFPGRESDVIGPAQVACQIGGFKDGLARRESKS